MHSKAGNSTLPDGWVRTTLDTLGEIYCGQSPSVSEVNTNEKGVPYVTGPEQWDGHRIERTKWTEHPRRIAPDGSIFITVKGAGIGKLFPGIHAAIGRDIYAFTPSGEVNADFIFYALRHTIDEIVLKGKGDIPGLSKSHILDHAIGLPGTNEQRRVVAKLDELFSELDNGVENLQRAREQLQVYRQALLKHAFEGKLTARWREEHRDKLETPEQLLDRLKQGVAERYRQQLCDWEESLQAWREGGECGRKPPRPRKPQTVSLIDTTNARVPPTKLADGWAWVRLGDISDVSGGLTKNPRRKSLKRRMKYLRVANVYADEVRTDDIREIGVTETEARKVALRSGDLLVVEGNGSIDQIGRVAVWQGEVPDCGHQNHLIRVRLGHGAHPRFLLQFLLSPRGRDLIVREASSTSGLHTLSISKVSSLLVPVASPAEQEEILTLLDARLSGVDKAIEEIDAQLARSAVLRRSILKRALAGRLVLQDPSDEHASDLLERIAVERDMSRNEKKARKTGA